MHALDACSFWADSPSSRDVDPAAVHGHRQITDADLVGVAARRSSVLATLDEALALEQPDRKPLVPR